MTAGESDELPRLPDVVPPRAHEQPTLPFGPADLGASHRPDEAIRQVHWVEYVEPELVSLRRPGLAVLGARVTLALWAGALVVVAWLVRLDLDPASASTTSITVVALVGLLVAASTAAVGWWWSDRATQNIHLLEGRFPRRPRCATAWAAPVIWFVALSFTILRLGPTEVVDVRPAIVGMIFAAALWRPYSLVRRILKSLIRVDSDLAVASGYLLDLALFGLLWARLSGFPDVLAPSDTGTADTLIGLGAVAAVAAVGNIAVWRLLIRDVDRAVRHRSVATRTRHDHRQLRLAGIDPLDPKVLLAMHTIRQETQHSMVAGAVSEGVDPDEEEDRNADATTTAEAAPDESLPTVAGPDTADDDAQVGDDDAQVGDDDAQLVDGAPSEEAPVVASSAEGVDPGRTVDTDEMPWAEEGSTVDRPDHVAARVDPVDSITRRLDRTRSAARVDPTESSVVGPDGSVPREDAARQDAGSESTSDSGTRGDRVSARQRRLDSDVPTDRIERLSKRFDSEAGSDESTSGIDRIGRLSQRLDQEAAAGASRSVLDRLERLGIEPGGSALPDDGLGWNADGPAETELVRDRIYSLELARYLLLLAAIICAGASVWFVVRSFDVRELSDGAIVGTELDGLETARIATVVTLAVVLAWVPVWCAVAARWANRVGIDVPGAVRCAVLACSSGLLLGVGFVVGPASSAMMFAVFGALGAALWSFPVMIEIARRSGYGTTIPALLPAALGASVLVAWAGGLLQPLAATDSVAAMSFFGGLVALLVALAAAVAVVSTGDVVEWVKLSPDVPEPQRRSSSVAA